MVRSLRDDVFDDQCEYQLRRGSVGIFDYYNDDLREVVNGEVDRAELAKLKTEIETRRQILART
jgi:hypothetical protein